MEAGSTCFVIEEHTYEVQFRLASIQIDDRNVANRVTVAGVTVILSSGPEPPKMSTSFRPAVLYLPIVLVDVLIQNGPSFGVGLIEGEVRRR